MADETTIPQYSRYFFRKGTRFGSAILSLRMHFAKAAEAEEISRSTFGFGEIESRMKEAWQVRNIPFFFGRWRFRRQGLRRACAIFNPIHGDSSPLPHRAAATLAAHVHRLIPLPSFPVLFLYAGGYPHHDQDQAKSLVPAMAGRQMPSAADESYARRADENEAAAVNGRASERVRVRTTYNIQRLLTTTTITTTTATTTASTTAITTTLIGRERAHGGRAADTGRTQHGTARQAER